MKKNSLSLILPVMFGFLAMGFIDMIGLVTNNVRADFNMSDGLVNTISLSSGSTCSGSTAASKESNKKSRESFAGFIF